MKENRIDILLAKVAFHQAIALGFGGGVFTELRDFNAARPKALMFSGTTALIFLLKVFHLYSRHPDNQKNQKRNHMDFRETVWAIFCSFFLLYGISDLWQEGFFSRKKSKKRRRA